MEAIPIDRDELTFSQQFAIANALARDRLPMINAREKEVEPPQTFYVRYGKRCLDIVLSFAALVVTLPINCLLALGTAIDVGRPLFFKQKRVGKDGREFILTKFRNMNNEVDERGELLPAAQRVSKFGRFVRKTSLDELLNFWFILKGDMSFIGPRPLVPEYTSLYSDRHRSRLKVKPGLECPPHDYRGERRTWQSRFENDVWYVEHVSFKTDCMLVCNLVKLALDSEDSAARSSGSEVGTFLGYDAQGEAMTLEGITQGEIDRVLGKKAGDHES